VLKRTAIALGSIAIALWIATSWLASDERMHERLEPIRAVVQGLAVTAAILAGIILVLRVVVPEVVERISDARRRAFVARPAYLPPTARDLATQVTMEIPKPRIVVPQTVVAEPLSPVIAGKVYRLGMRSGQTGRRL